MKLMWYKFIKNSCLFQVPIDLSGILKIAVRPQERNALLGKQWSASPVTSSGSLPTIAQTSQ